MAQELDREKAALLFEKVGLEVTNTRIHPRQHKGNVVFVGYADFQITIDGTPLIQLCGNSIKLMNEQIHFDPKSEAGRGQRAGQYFPHWFPMTAESRAVLAEKLKRDPQIIDMVQKAISQLSSTPIVAADGNPFNR